MLKRGIWVIVGLFLFSCAQLEKRVTLEDRVRNYWMAIVSLDFTKAYGFEYPLYRKMVPLRAYVSRMSGGGIVTIKSFRVLKKKVSGDRAEVTIKLDMVVKPPFERKGLEIHPVRKDVWIRVDGVWYHVPEEYEKLRGSK